MQDSISINIIESSVPRSIHVTIIFAGCKWCICLFIVHKVGLLIDNPTLLRYNGADST